MRLKIISGNLLVVLVMGFGAFLLVRTEVRDALEARLQDEMSHAAPTFGRSFGVSALELLTAVQEQANSSTLRGVFTLPVGERRRERAFSACESVEGWFNDPARDRDGKPEIVAITDAAGALVARSSSVNLLIEDDLASALPTLTEVLQDGVARHDVWNRPDSGLLLQVGIAPVRGGDGAVLGSLLVGYDLSNGVAAQQADVLGRDVAFITNDSVYSSSLDSTTVSALQQVLFDPSGLAKQTAAAVGGEATSPWNRDVGGRDLVGVTGRVPMARSAPVGFVVLADRAAFLEPARDARWILLLMGLAMVAIVIYGMMLAVSIIHPLEEIEEAVLGVINGQTDLRIDVRSNELGGLAYRINQLINELTGVPEDTGDGVQRPSADDWQQVREDTGRISTVPTNASAAPTEEPEAERAADEGSNAEEQAAEASSEASDPERGSEPPPA